MESRIKLKLGNNNLSLKTDLAIPVGLIINELVTNSLKYAFPNETNGEISIDIWNDNMGKLNLKVADNGYGIMPKPEMIKSNSFGLNLVDMLTKKLHGHINTVSEEGYQTHIEFENKKL